MLRPEKLAAHLFEVDEDVEKDEVSPPIPMSHRLLTIHVGSCEEQSIQQTLEMLITMTLQGQQVQPFSSPHKLCSNKLGYKLIYCTTLYSSIKFHSFITSQPLDVLLNVVGLLCFLE